jgi:hypothetical protein
MAEYSADTSDPRWKEFAMNEQKTSRDLLLFALISTVIINLFSLSVILKDYFSLRNICCVRQKVFFGTFLTRPLCGLIIGMYSVILGFCIITVDVTQFEFILGIISSAYGFILFAMSLINIRIRLYTTRHKEIEEIWSDRRRNDISNTLRSVKKQIIIPFTRD